MKLKIKNQFGTPLNLRKADSITIFFPREDEGFLEKRDVTILDFENGIIEVNPTDFELQGFKEGIQQDFFAEVVCGDEKLTVQFHKGLSIGLRNGRKAFHV